MSTYYLYVNGVRTEALSGAQTFRALGGLNPRTTYTVQVQALDQFGNRSALSAPVSFVTGSPPPALPNPLRAFGQFFPTNAPDRILDTRVGIGGIAGPLTGGAPVRFPVLGVGGVPATGVQSVVLNMTVAEPTQGGFVTIYPTGEARPTASNLNFAAGETVPNLVQARVGVDGTVEAFLNAGSSHLIADVVGWFASSAETRPGARIESQSPERVLDTRPASRVGPHGPVGRGQAIEVQVVPAGQGYTGVVLNLTGTEPTSSTYVTAFPGHLGAPPVASNLNLRPGETRPNLVMVGVSPQGTIKLFNFQGSTQLIVDVVARFRGTTALDANPAGRVLALDTPIRLVDTRITPGAARRTGRSLLVLRRPRGLDARGHRCARAGHERHRDGGDGVDLPHAVPGRRGAADGVEPQREAGPEHPEPGRGAALLDRVPRRLQPHREHPLRLRRHIARPRLVRKPSDPEIGEREVAR